MPINNFYDSNVSDIVTHVKLSDSICYFSSITVVVVLLFKQKITKIKVYKILASSTTI